MRTRAPRETDVVRRFAAAAVLSTAVALGVAGCNTSGTDSAPTQGDATAEPTPPSSPVISATTPRPSPVPPSPPQPTDEASEPVTASEVVGGLDRPWDVAFTPDGRAFLTEQDTGRVLELRDEGGVSEVHRFDVAAAGEGGLLGLAVSPDYSEDGLLYAYMSTDSDNRVVRFSPGGSAEAVVTGIPHGTIHNGGRIAFGPDDLLYIGTGDAGEGSRSQDPESLGGKILRVDPDGSAPTGNPFGTAVYSLGHRNVQGLSWDSDGQLYASEFGPDADDEINRIMAGGNYGWPEVTGTTDSDEFIDPVYVQQPPDASWSGMAFSVQPAVPQWAGDLLVASLRGERLWRLELGGQGTVTDAEELYVGEFGRLRTAAYAPDGALWLVTSNTDIYGSPREGDDRIIRLAPEA